MAGITGKDAALTAYANALAAEAPKGRSLTQDALRRLFNNKAALVSIFVLTAIVLFALVGPYLLPWAYDKIDWAGIRKPPDWAKGHYFGTDQNGRDMLARTLQGTQMSLLVAAVATFVSVVIGILYGAIAGYFGGKIDAVMMRFVDIMYALPYILFVIILVVIFGRSPVLLFVGIGCLEWLTMARIVRGQTLSIKQREFIEAAKAGGAGPFTIIFRHIVPNLTGPVRLGTMCRKMMLHGLAPPARAASMNSRSLRLSVCPRTMRAMVSHSMHPMPTNSSTGERPKMTTRMMTNRM